MESSSVEYQTNIEVNRLEAYEGLLLDENSALFRELKVRKERRSHPQTPVAMGEGVQTGEQIGEEEKGEGLAGDHADGDVELTTVRKSQASGLLFEIESEEEEEGEGSKKEGGKGMRKMPLPKVDPGRDVGIVNGMRMMRKGG